MENKKNISLPENAYRELKAGEEYQPVMPAQSTPAEATPYSVTMGVIMAIIFSAAAAFLGLKVGQVFEAAIPIAILAAGFGSLRGKKRSMLGENVIMYFSGVDEATGDRLLSQLTAWQAARDVGAKVIVSGFSQFCDKIGGKLDICVLNDDPANADAASWHAKGTMLWKYNTPQAGPEDPGVFRRNYGLDLWRRSFDGASTYCDVSKSTVWNDVAEAQARKAAGRTTGDVYRGLCMVYPTVDGVVETLALTGLESAIKDVRVMTKLRQLLRNRPDLAAQRWLDSIDYRIADPVDIRRAAIDHILRLSTY